MKIIDRYVIFSFVRNYIISFMVLVGMYVVLDMVFNFNNLVNFQNSNATGMQSIYAALYDIFDYYFYQCFLIFVHLSGIIPVVAAAFTLMRLSRFNELTAMLAAGLPLLRVAAPVILVAVVLNGLLLIDQELVIPEMIPKLIRDHDEVHRGAANYYPIQLMQDSANGLVCTARYFPNPAGEAPYMLDLDVVERAPATRTENGQSRTLLVPAAHLQADEAHWNPKSHVWDLVHGRRVSGLNDIHVTPEEPCAIYTRNETPEEIAL